MRIYSKDSCANIGAFRAVQFACMANIGVVVTSHTTLNCDVVTESTCLIWICIAVMSRGGCTGGDRLSPLKHKKVTLFKMILYNAENNIRDIRPFCRPLFCHRSVVKYTSSLLQ